MTSLSNIDLSTAYEDEAAAAPDKVSAAKLDADHLAIEAWINAQLLPMLAKVIRSDDTLVDYLVRKRNLHPEIWGDLVTGLGSVPLAVPADYSVTTLKVALLAITTGLLADAAVTNAKMATVATATIKGRSTAGTGAPEDLTTAQVTAMLNAMIGDSGAGGLKGLVPAQAAGDALKVLLGSGAWSFLPFYGRIANSAEVAITAAVAATLNRMHVISGTGASYSITLPAASAGDVVGFRVKDWSLANREFTLDAGGAVKIAGRTRYLVLLHTNVVLLRFDGADWQPLVLNLDTPMVSSATVFGTSLAVKSASIVKDSFNWCRQGKRMVFQFGLVWTGSGTAGSGTYNVILPLGTTDTAFVTNPTGPLADSAGYVWGDVYFSSALSWANGRIWSADSQNWFTCAILKMTTAPAISMESWTSSSSYTFATANLAISGNGSLPMLNW